MWLVGYWAGPYLPVTIMHIFKHLDGERATKRASGFLCTPGTYRRSVKCRGVLAKKDLHKIPGLE
jgi:hypothetical protein